MPLTHLYFVASAVCLGVGAVLTKSLLSGESETPGVAESLRVLMVQLIGGIAFITVVCSVRGWRAGRLADMRRPAQAGLILGVGSVGTILALALISASVASLVFATQPMIVLGLAWLLLGERISAPLVLLCGLAVLGVVLIVAGGEETGATGYLGGLAFALLSAACAALYTVWMRGLSGTQDLLKALLVVQSVACVVAASVWVGTALANSEGFAFGAAPSVPLVVGSGALYYGMAYLLYLLGLETTEASTAGIYLSLVPVFTIALAYSVLGEKLAPIQWLGAVVVVAAVAAVFLMSDRRG
ncbi:MAG: DMT family transporter [Pseudomonadota bacterium]